MKMFCITLILFFCLFQIGNAEQITYPGKPQFSSYTNNTHNVSISFPSSWTMIPSIRNEFWISTGIIREHRGACMVRVSDVENLHLLTHLEYFEQVDEKEFVKINSIGMPDIKVHLYKLSHLHNKLARHIIYSGTDDQIKTGTVSYQALDGDKIFTINCFAEVSEFQMLYNDFEAVISSFTFDN